MKDRAIVNVAVNGHYPRLQRKVLDSCAMYCSDADLLFFSTYPEGCPPHNEQQYAFKIYAMQEAIDKGYRSILWMDCTFRPIGSIERLWMRVSECGWYIPKQGNSHLNTWASDAALEVYGIDREAARGIQLVFSGLVGLNMESEIGAEIWRRWKELFQRGAFNGAHRSISTTPDYGVKPWGSKFEGFVSATPSVEGHRHDESALSFILWSLGLAPAEENFLTLESSAGFIARNFECQ